MHCRVQDRATEADSVLLGGAIKPGKKLWRKGGCEACHHEGYRGRAGLYEVVAVDERLQAMIHNGVAEAELERAARVHNPALLDDGVAKVKAGLTTVEEVARVVREEG